jgi:hypothetical protein
MNDIDKRIAELKCKNCTSYIVDEYDDERLCIKWEIIIHEEADPIGNGTCYKEGKDGA